MSGGFVLVPIGYSQQLIFRTVRCLYLWRTKQCRGERTQTGQKTYFDYICQNNDVRVT